MIGLIKGTARQLKTVSGLPLPIASYKSNSKLPIQELSLSINPTQSGSGDPAPDNIRPITGVSSVNVTRTGKNMLPMPITSGSYSNQVTITVNNDKSFYVSKPSSSGWTTIPLATMMLKKGTYTLIEDDDLSNNCAINVYLAGTTTSLINTRYAKRYVFTVTEDTKVDINYSRSAAANNVLTKLMLFVGNTATATDYEPYTGNTYLIQLGDTYYGATLDVVRGRGSDTLDSVKLADLSWTYDTTTLSVPVFKAEVVGRKTGSTINYCEIYKCLDLPRSDLVNHNFALATWNTTSSRQIAIRDDRFTDVTTFTNSLGGTLLYYELATPIEIDLTPTQINSLLGQNHIWHDGNGDVEVLKFMDRQLYFGR